jgi:4-hydroxybenzoate polyprenyltransferase
MVLMRCSINCCRRYGTGTGLRVRYFTRVQRWCTLNTYILRGQHKRLDTLALTRSFSTPRAPPEQIATVPSSSWIEHDRVPVWVRPYLHLARADKQIGTLLLLLPCYWGVAVASATPVPDVFLMTKFTVGAIAMRSAGCVINDMWDQDFDRHVERTKLRPLASGALTNGQAVAFLGTQLAAGCAVLLTLNPPTVLLGVCSLPLVVVYPLMKRFTNYPQFVLGLTFNWGALVGYTAATCGSTSMFDVLSRADSFTALSSALSQVDIPSLAPVLPMYAAGVCWTLVYDTLYGYQDRADDAKLGTVHCHTALLRCC